MTKVSCEGPSRAGISGIIMFSGGCLPYALQTINGPMHEVQMASFGPNLHFGIRLIREKDLGEIKGPLIGKDLNRSGIKKDTEVQLGLIHVERSGMRPFKKNF
jgi:hypothetical protein